MREMQEPGEHAEPFRAMKWVIVLRKQPASEAGSERRPGSYRSLLFAATWNDRCRRKNSADEGGPAMEPLLLKAGEAAKLLGLGRSKVFAMLAVGELPVIRIGRSVRVPRAALEDWIAEHTQHASGRSRDAGPLFAEVEDRDATGGAGRALLAGDVRKEPAFGPGRASPKASSRASS
jgi:excisionase family DNA binding protein